MKLKKILYGVSFAAIVIAAGSSCNKAKFNINRNPNNPTDSSVTYDVVLPSALHATGTIVATQWGPIQNWMSYWSRSGTYAPSVIEETYQITTGFGNGIWNACYDNNYDYNIVQSKANKAGAPFYEGVARIMKALNYQMLVDVYGNVPYTQALKGSGNPTPVYDNGLDIYKALLREIDAGIALIKGSQPSATNADKNIWTNDIMFGNATTGAVGDVGAMKVKWAKFANTLKLRMLLHCYAVAGINKATEIGIINTEGSGYIDAGSDASVQPGYKSDKPNPFYNSYKATTAGTQSVNNVYYAANKWGIEYYGYNGDTYRQTHFYAAGTLGYVGVPYGLPPTTANAAGAVASIGASLTKTNSASQCIFSASESFFLQAEARQRGIITSGPTAAALLKTAVEENFRYLGDASYVADAATYMSNNAGYADVDITAAPLHAGFPAGGIFTILSQKWFAMNGISTLEIWTDYRRVPYSEVATVAGANTSHFVYGAGVDYAPGPAISVSPQLPSGAQIPVRYLYPQTEYNYNAGNVAAQGTVVASTRIFWDIN